MDTILQAFVFQDMMFFTFGLLMARNAAHVSDKKIIQVYFFFFYVIYYFSKSFFTKFPMSLEGPVA